MAKSWQRVRALTLAVAATVGFARLASAQPAGDANPGVISAGKLAQTYLQQEVTALNSGRLQAERDDAARRLVARRTDVARQEIAKALAARPEASPAASTPLAAARGIADDVDPAPEFVPALEGLLGVDRTHSESAAAALIAIRTDAALASLTRFVSNPAARGSPLAVIRIMGSSTDRRVAETLVNLTTNPRTDQVIANAAADALASMTLLSENGRDPIAWGRWWQSARVKPAEAFRAELLDQRRRRLPGEALSDVDALVGRLFQLAEERNRPEAMRRVLESPDARFRLAGVRLVFQTFIATGRLVDGTAVRLRDMIRDPSPDVRQEVARTLQGLNDAQSLEPLLAQLAVEPDAGVRVAIMAALVPINDRRAAAEIVPLLNDPSLRVAVAAAESLAKLGNVIRADPALTAQVVGSLSQTLLGRARQDPTGELKAACIEAFVPLRDPRQQTNFLGLLNLNETKRTRVAAIAGLGAIGDRNAGNAVVNWLRGEPEAIVRLAALGALRTVGTFQLDEAIFDYTKTQVEPDAGNRKAAWDTFVALLPDGSNQRLTTWAERFFRAGEFDRRIPVLREILKKQEAAVPAEAQAAAITREQIGESYMKLQPPQPQAAIPFYRDALTYWLANNGAQQVILGLTKSLLEAQIAARQYAEAVAFAGESIKNDPKLMPDVMAILTSAADRLNEVAQPRDAERLATEALKLTNVDQRFRARLDAAIRKSKE
ncbi:HEAT repeat domain-containing protein [Humisphaera borealis]|uniref:HEAT repeat domain-containing protein n=1 Tax=Humisphaera borealis TaxID=2807512 RepID=A0A7M2WRC8_9BACT|nr:HEAT repeat domain-containing protein [Humisphaera borealis]QOV88087.1 HEAT repeat domain-containing protein [Humisphaera borealis]